MYWLILFFAGLCEVLWAMALEESDGFHKFWPSVITLFGMTASIVLLTWSLKQLPIGTAYAVWTGIGATGTVLGGIWLYHDSAAWPRLMCIAFIIIGIVGLRLLPDAT